MIRWQRRNLTKIGQKFDGLVARTRWQETVMESLRLSEVEQPFWSKCLILLYCFSGWVVLCQIKEVTHLALALLRGPYLSLVHLLLWRSELDHGLVSCVDRLRPAKGTEIVIARLVRRFQIILGNCLTLEGRCTSIPSLASTLRCCHGIEGLAHKMVPAMREHLHIEILVLVDQRGLARLALLTLRRHPIRCYLIVILLLSFSFGRFSIINLIWIFLLSKVWFNITFNSFWKWFNDVGRQEVVLAELGG